MPDQSPFPIATDTPNPADPTNSVAGPYVPSAIQTGIPALPVSAQMGIDQRLGNLFNPALTAADVPGPKTDFSDFTNHDQNPLPPGMSLKDAFFSSDPKIKALANNIMNQSGQKDQFTRAGGGNSIDTPFDQAKRFDNTKLGFSPLTNNESAYAQNQGLFSSIGNSLVNLVGKTAAYAAQNIGLVGGAIAAALPGQDISDMTDNFVTRAGDWLKDKVSEDFPIYKSDKYTNGNIFQKLGTLGWWLDDGMDRLALTAAMFVPGLAEMKGISLAGSIGADGVATGLAAKGLQAIAADPEGYGTIMKAFLPKLYKAAAEGAIDLGTSPALKSYVRTLSRAEMGAWNVLGQSGLNAKETYEAILKNTGDKQKAADGAIKSFYETLPLSMGNTLIELPQMFSTMNTAKSMLNKVLDKETGLVAADALLIKGPSIAKTIGKALLTGLEHGQNESMQVAVSRYNEDFANGKDQHDDPFKAMAGIFGDFLDNIHDPNGQNNIALGTIQGILTTLGGRAIAKYKGEDKKELAQRQALVGIINQAQTQRRFNNGDFAQRDDQGSIKTDDKGKIVYDQQKLAAAGVSLAGVQANLQMKQEAIKRGDYATAALADHISLAGLAQAYFGDPNGIEHLTNLLKMEAKAAELNTGRLNDHDADGREITPQAQLQDHLDTIQTLKRAYDAVEERHAGFMNLDIDPKNKIQVEAAKQFIGNLKNAQYQEASTQIFLNKELEKNKLALSGLDLSPNEAALHPDTKLIESPSDPLEEKYNDLIKDNKDIQQAIQESKDRYKTIINKEAQKAAFKDQIAMTQQVISKVAQQAQKKTTEATTSPAEPEGQFTPPVTITPQPTTPSVQTQTTPADQATATPTQSTSEATQTPTQESTPSEPDGGSIEDRMYSTAPDGENSGFNVIDPDGNIIANYPEEDQAKAVVEHQNAILTGEPQAIPVQESTPPAQEAESVIADNADNLQQIQQQLNEENTEFGKMIVNSLSVATKAVDYDNETGIAPKDDLGRPRFNSNQNPDIDFGKILPGAKIYLKLATEQSVGYQPGLDTEGNADLAQIRVYTKSGKNTRDIGYLHTLQGARRLLTQNVDVQSELVKLANLRSQILANPGTELEATVTQTGFGFANKGDNRGYKNINDATEKDSNAIIAVKKGDNFVGEGGIVMATRFGNGIKEGATVLMLPNNVNGSDVLIPTYVAKKAVGTDPSIRAIVEPAIRSYLSTGNKEDLNPARDYVYITSSGTIAISLTNNGLFLNPTTGELIYRGTPISDTADLMNKLLVNINEKKLTDRKYASTWRDSPSVQTAFFARTQGTERSYFHQHTIQFTDPLNKTTNTNNGKSNESGSKSGPQINQIRTGQAQQQAGNASLQEGRAGQERNEVAQRQQASPADLIRRGETKLGRAKDVLSKQNVVFNIFENQSLSEDLLNSLNYFKGLLGLPPTEASGNRLPFKTTYALSKTDIENKWDSLLVSGLISGRLDYVTFQPENALLLLNALPEEYKTPAIQYLINIYALTTNKETGEYKNLIKKVNYDSESLYKDLSSDMSRWEKGSTDSKESDALKAFPEKVREIAAKYDKQLEKEYQSSTADQQDLDRLNQELANDLENNGFIVDDISESHDLSEIAVEQAAQQPSSLLIPGFNAFVQEDAINSISQLLLSEPTGDLIDTLFGDTATNKDRVKLLIDKELDKYNQLVSKYQPLVATGNARAIRIQNVAKNLQNVADNYDTIHKLAVERLTKIGLIQDEQGYYAAANEDDDFLRYDDDSEYTRNNYDSISRLVKQFISFNSEKIEKDGKIGNRLNNIGLPQVVQPAAVYTKIINWVSDNYFAPTLEGFQDMIEHLSNIPDPTIKDIAQRLNSAKNSQLKFQFFTNMLKFKTDHVQQLVTINAQGVFGRNIEANRNQQTKVVFDQLSDEFLQLSKVLSQTTDDYGNTIYRVDKAQVQPHVEEFVRISKDRSSYGFRKDQNGQPTNIKFLGAQAAERLYAILQTLGFNFNPQTLGRAISAKTASNPRGDAQVGIQALFTGGNKILRNMAEGEAISQERDLHNPFISNPTEMNTLSRIESGSRNITQADSFRSNGKSYYPFTRMSFVKSIFQQIQQYASTGQITPLLQTFTQDPFKSASRFLQAAKNDASFSPELWFARGTRETGTKSQNQEVKDMNDKDFVIGKLFGFQNSGNDSGLFFSDTYSDKTTRFQIKAPKEDIKVTFDEQGKAHVDMVTINKFYNYFQGELRRVNQVRDQNNTLPQEQRISGFHDSSSGKEGIGKYFVVFNFLNQETLPKNVADAIYAPDGSVKGDATAISAIKQMININLVTLVERYKTKLERYGVFSDVNGRYSAKGINDTDYYKRLSTKLNGLNEDKKAFLLTADYLLNSSLNSLEMLTLTGDPAQSPKVKATHSGKIRLNQSIKATLTEVSKRNASLNAPFDQGISTRAEYGVGFLQDLKINSDQVALYKSLLPSQAAEVEAGYRNGDMTDAQEATTVKEHLSNLLSLGRISPVEFAEALAHFDPDDFDDSKQELISLFHQLGIEHSLDIDTLRATTAKKDMTQLLNVLKPVQRYSRWDPNLGMIVETYIKTSSFPLVPALVKGKDFEEVLKQMKVAKIDRINFSSGTKQGLINPQSIYASDGSVNPSIFTNNTITLPAAAWGEQVQNPEKESLKVTEGSQQQRLIFVDLPDNATLNYKGQPITGKELRQKYVDDHRTIFQAKKQALFEELGVESADGVNNFTSLGKLSDILQSEGISRDYDRNTLLSLNLNSKGQFEIPLTFLPNSSEIQALVAAVISNRILKNKLPGTSLIQGSEMVIKTNGKVKVSADITQAKEGIVWAKPEYANISKLQYIRVENGEVKPAQIVLPFYFKTKSGNSVKLSDYVKDGFLDTSKIDPDLLEINGFRIPYAGPNSGMWFEVVGYLPETMGSLVLVPAEVAAQMGADYDVDKLFTYVLNHTVSANGIRVDNSTTQKSAENDIIHAHKAVYLNKERLAKTIEPTSTDELSGAVERNLPRPSQDVTQIYDPAHQDEVWLSNRAGQLGVAISANFNTFHSLAQQANLFTKGFGVKFLDKEGNVYNETHNAGEENNTITGDVLHENYNFEDDQNALTDNGVNRLDRINTFPNPYSGQTRSISSVINNWLQASVDNAKLQVLGAGGINKLNFNAALTIALHGFDSDWIIPFINQPILKEYYSQIGGLNDKFNKDFSTDKRGNSINDLFKKYVSKLGVEKYNFDSYTGVSHAQLVDGVMQEFEGMNKDQIATQLEVLKQFLNLDTIGSTISGISGDTKVEVRGLSKSFSEINQQAKDIDGLGESVVGNIDKLKAETVSGVYLDVPSMIDDLFNHPDNPLFAYSTPVYQTAAATIQALRGRGLNAEEIDDVFKELKQFFYSHPSLGLHSEANPLSSIKKSSLSERQLVKNWEEMKAKYPNSILLNQLSSQSTVRENDPGILTMQSAADDIATQIKQEWLDFFKSTDMALVTFINQLTTYSLLFGSKEYGPSNMLKYIPFEVLKGIGFGDKLNDMNRLLTNPDLIKNFYRQNVQHNPESVKFLSNRSLPKNTLYQQVNGKPSQIPAQFTLGEPTLQYLDANPTYKSIASPDTKGEFSYRPFIRTFVNDVVGNTLYELQTDGKTYGRIDTLGNQYINEYDFTNPDVRTIFPLKQAVQLSDQVDPTPQAAADNPNPTADDITAMYSSGLFNESGTVGRPQSVDDVLDNIQLRAAADTTPVGQLHYELAKSLVGTSKYAVFFGEGITRGSILHSQEKISIYPNEIKRVADTLGTSYEQELQRTILHESVHAAVDGYMQNQSVLPSSKQSAEYKEVTRVYNAYRKNLIESGSSTFVRGIQDTFLQAELFKTLYERFKENRTKGATNEADITSVFKNWDAVKENTQDLLSLIHTMGESMKKAHAEQGISTKADFDLVKKVGDKYQPIDTERVAQVVDYLDKNFTKEAPGSLKNKYYAYVSPFEFNTMTMTSPGFMSHLNSIETGKESHKTLWDKFKDIVRKIVSSFNNTSLLAQAIDAVLDISKASAAEEVRDSVDLNGPNAEEKLTNLADTPPWDDTTQKVVIQTIPTTESERSFTFADGVAIPTAFALNSQQKEALQMMADHVAAVKTGKQSDRLFTLSGFAGTGKSSTSKYLVQYLNKKWRGQITFKLASPTHKANKVLGRFFRGTINEDPVTTKSLLGYKAERDPITNKTNFVLDERKNRIPSNGVLIIDEASFIGQKEFQDILAAAAQKSAIVIFMGDIAQIPSPDGSNKVSPAFGLKNQYQLTKVERQSAGNPLAPIYDIVRNNLLVDGFAKLFAHKTDINEKGEGIQFISGDYRDTGKLLAAALKDFKSEAFKTNKMAAKIVAYGNPTVEMYNREVRNAILASSAEDFQVGELLMGYGQKQEIPTVQNGQDYVITDRRYVTDKRIRDFHVSGFELRLKEADEDPNRTRTVPTFVINPKDLSNQEFIQHYVDLLEKMRNAKGRDYFEVLDKITEVEEQGLVPETMYSYQGKAYTNSMLREQFPLLFKYDEVSKQRPIDKMTSIEKNIDYGYAVTSHKVQGSTYTNVFIDENNLEFDKRMIQSPSGQNFSYERNNLLYVALSRPTTKATVLSKNTLSEQNIHSTTPLEAQQTRSISDLLTDKQYAENTIAKIQEDIKNRPGDEVKNQAMSYQMPASENLTGKDTTTLALAEQGIRTATTRSFPLGKVGDVITFEGKPQRYKITGVEQLTSEKAKDPAWIKQWSQKEQWTETHFHKVLGGSTVHIGSYQTSFERVNSAQPATSGPKLDVSDSNVDKIRKGIKTYMNTSKPVTEGNYFLKDGTKVQISYNGEAMVIPNKGVLIAPDPEHPETGTLVPLDEYAKREGYTNWSDFSDSAKASAGFAMGMDIRHSYSIKAVGRNYDISDTIQKLTDDGQLTKKDC